VHAIKVNEIGEGDNEESTEDSQRVDVILIREKGLDTSGNGSGSAVNANAARLVK
jgi:hypothetical protein